MFRHLIQRFAFENTTLLLGIGEGIVRCQIHRFDNLPVHNRFHTAHIGFIDVDTVTDEIVGFVIRIFFRTDSIGSCTTTADFGDLIFKVSVKDSQAHIEIILIIPQHTDLFGDTFLRFQIRVTENNTVQTAAAGHLTP